MSDTSIHSKFVELEKCVTALVSSHVRAITPPNQFADTYESFDASPEARAALAALLALKRDLGGTDLMSP